MEPLLPPRKRRHPSLTPMIDVVFLLLVFFMLAARFGADMALPLPLAGAGTGYSGPPRLIEIAPDRLLLNGAEIPPEALTSGLATLVESHADAIILQGRDGADLQRLVDVTQELNAAGFINVVLVK
ncbi:MAG: ExbD/TolR family protein [Tropicimonas sp.]|uniref:ExbD/TolR family protein n=1 Tax=Tropicimonas sp. TaxID=2067044 RepID=UPI003A89955C